MVFRRWAIVKTVQSLNSDLIVDWMRSSVSRSTAAVASSKTRIFVFRSKALARQSNCLWPTLKTVQCHGSFRPLHWQIPARWDTWSFHHLHHTLIWSDQGGLLLSSSGEHALRLSRSHCHSSCWQDQGWTSGIQKTAQDPVLKYRTLLSQDFEENSSYRVLYKQASLNWALTWGMMVSLDLVSCKPTEAMSRLSMWILPPAASMMRNKARVMDDLPAPVRPTTPTWN